FDFFHEARQLPQLRCVRLIAVVGAKLIVVVILDAGGGKVAVERFPVLVRQAWPAMKEEHLDRRVVADALGPHPKDPFCRCYRDQLYATAKYVVSTGIIPIRCGNIEVSVHECLRRSERVTLRTPSVAPARLTIDSMISAYLLHLAELDNDLVEFASFAD